MPLREFLDLARFFSTQASAANRNLALGGIAIIWVFKKTPAGIITPGLLNLPMLLLAWSLALDLLQYFIGAAAWNWFYERKYKAWEKKNFDDPAIKDIEAPNSISVPITALFYIKIITMGAAYYFIISYLWKVL